MKEWPPLRCKLPCGCWVEWMPLPTILKPYGHHWSYGCDWSHPVSEHSLHYESIPRDSYLLAAMVASGYGLAKRAKSTGQPKPARPRKKSTQWRDRWPHKRRHSKKDRAC